MEWCQQHHPIPGLFRMPWCMTLVILWQLSNWGRRKAIMELQDVTKLSWKLELKETHGSSDFQTVFSSRTLSLSPKGKCSWIKGTALAEARWWEWSVDSHLAFPGFLCWPFKRIKGSGEYGLTPLFNSNTSTLQSRELRESLSVLERQSRGLFMRIDQVQMPALLLTSFRYNLANYVTSLNLFPHSMVIKYLPQILNSII